MFEIKSGIQAFHSLDFGLWSLSFVLCFPDALSMREKSGPREQRSKTKVQRPSFRNKKAASEAALRCSFCCGSFNNYYSLFLVKVREHHLDDFAFLGRHELPDVIGLNRQFAMFVPAIY